MDIKKELGEKIKRTRKKRGLTQEQLAEKIDISSRNLSNIELGLNFPKSDTLEKILKSLDITTEELFANDYIKAPKELIADIYKKINIIQNDQQKLEIAYKMLDFIVSL